MQGDYKGNAPRGKLIHERRRQPHQVLDVHKVGLEMGKHVGKCRRGCLMAKCGQKASIGAGRR